MLNDFISLFYPRNCICCKRPLNKGETDCCLFCITELPRTNFVNYSDNPVAKLFWGRIQLTYGFSVFSFTQSGKLQSLLHGLKYQNKTQVGIFLGREIGKTLQSSSYLDQIDLVLPIPLHPKKEHLRGYNQCDYIVEGITEVTRLPSSSKAIQRTVHTSSQTKRAKYDRWQNVSSIFETTAIQRIQGKNILLVDDVITTGSTLESCARELLNKGAKSVGIAVVASGI